MKDEVYIKTPETQIPTPEKRNINRIKFKSHNMGNFHHPSAGLITRSARVLLIGPGKTLFRKMQGCRTGLGGSFETRRGCEEADC